MKKALNKIYHVAGTVAIAYGLMMGCKAAGMADLGGDFTEMVHVVLAGVSALICGAFLEWWRV